MDEEKAKKLNKITKRLFQEVRPEDVFGWDKTNKVLTLGGKLLTREQTGELIEEAKALQSMALWKLLVKGMEYEACKRMYMDSISFDDMLAGKWMLYTLDLLKQKVKNLAKLV